MANPNPNEPNSPYGGGTDNPGDDTSKAGGGVMTETGDPTLVSPVPGYPTGLAAGHSDTVLPPGVQAVPPSGAGFESGADYGDASSDTGGPDPTTGRTPGQDETAGETETSPDRSPAAFPEPSP